MNTSPMNTAQLKDYLENHLSNELQWTLRASTEWHVQDRIGLGVDGYHVQVYAMDSTFLHSRTLFEFFTKATGRNYYGCDEFGLLPITSLVYTNDWVRILHGYLMHAQDRSSPRQLPSFDGAQYKDLNQMPVDFAREIVRLWREFANGLSASSDSDMCALAPTADAILIDAIANAERIRRRPSVQEPDLSSVLPITW